MASTKRKNPKMPNILVACTGSVATIKLPVLINSLREKYKTLKQKVEVKVVLTECAKNFVTFEELPANLEVFTDSSEWAAWKKRGDPILHIDLGKWADVLVVAPLDANTLGKISSVRINLHSNRMYIEKHFFIVLGYL